MDHEYENETYRQQPSLTDTIEALKAEQDGGLNATIFYGLSERTESEMEQVQPVWKTLSPAYRRKLMRLLGEMSETNFELDYRSIGLMGLDDDDPAVREAAIGVLWWDESLELMGRLIDMALHDSVREVRAAAASDLGRFILLGELGNLPESKTVRAQDAVIRLWNDPNEDVDVRRRALEAIANCSHEIVVGAINQAYRSSDRRMRISAVFAMGRTYDERWHDIVLQEMDSEDSEMRYEAARAAGELEMARAIPRLAALAEQTEDREIKEVAIWSLGEIGGNKALKVLSKLAQDAYDDEDDELLNSIEDAIANASLVDGDLPFMLLGE